MRKLDLQEDFIPIVKPTAVTTSTQALLPTSQFVVACKGSEYTDDLKTA